MKGFDIQSSLKLVCLNSEGRGRIAVSGQTFLFQYESVNNIQKKEWGIGVALPLGGDEALFMNYKDAFLNRVRLSGPFYQRILGSLNRPGQRRLLKQFLVVWGKILILLLSPDGLKKWSGLSWKMDSQTMRLQIPLEQGQEFLLEAKNPLRQDRKIYFQSLKFSMRGPVGSNKAMDIALHLFLSTCD